MAQEVDAVAGADVEHERADIAHHAHAEAGDADVEPVAAAAWPCATPHLDAGFVHQLRVLVLGQVFCDSGGERCAFLLSHGLSPVKRRPPVAGGGNLVWGGVLMPKFLKDQNYAYLDWLTDAAHLCCSAR